MKGIKIRGTGLAVPSKLVTNGELARMVETTDEWILTRTGIETRHHMAPGETLTELTVRAGEEAIRRAGIQPDEIGACIVATITSDTIVPSAACILQRELGLPEDIPCFDLNAACTGFIFALHTMECLLNAPGNHRKYGLVLGAEHLSRVTDWEDRSTCILFGDGAAGVVVESGEDCPSIFAQLGCHGNHSMLNLAGVDAEHPSYIRMEGKQVFKFAVQAVPYCMDRVLKASGRTVDEIDFFVFHQANARIIDLVVRKYHIPPEKYYKNISKYGNTSSASIPLVLAELDRQGKVKSGSKVLMVGFGGGLTWGGALAEFA